MSSNVRHDRIFNNLNTTNTLQIPRIRNLTNIESPKPAAKIAYNVRDKRIYASNGTSWNPLSSSTLAEILATDPTTGPNPIIFPVNTDSSDLASYLALPSSGALNPTDTSVPIGSMVTNDNGQVFVFQGPLTGWVNLGPAGGIIASSAFVPTQLPGPPPQPLYDIILNTAYAGPVPIINGRTNLMFGETTVIPPRASDTVKLVFNANTDDGTGTNVEIGSFRAGKSRTGQAGVFPTYSVAFGEETSVSGASHGFVHGLNSSANAEFSFVHGNENTVDVNSISSVVLGGSTNTITNASNSVILGGTGLTLASSNTVLVPNLSINDAITSNIDMDGNDITNVGTLSGSVDLNGGSLTNGTASLTTLEMNNGNIQDVNEIQFVNQLTSLNKLILNGGAGVQIQYNTTPVLETTIQGISILVDTAYEITSNATLGMSSNGAFLRLNGLSGVKLQYNGTDSAETSTNGISMLNNAITNVSNIQTIVKDASSGIGLGFNGLSVFGTPDIISFFVFEHDGTNPIYARVTLQFEGVRLRNTTGGPVDVIITDTSVTDNIIRFDANYNAGTSIYQPSFATFIIGGSITYAPVVFRISPNTPEIRVQDSSGNNISVANNDSIELRGSVSYVLIRN